MASEQSALAPCVPDRALSAACSVGASEPRPGFSEPGSGDAGALAHALRLPGEFAADSGLASGRPIMLTDIVNSPACLCRQSDV
jgi:hypothetical protein